ncbi:MAG: trypsin-like peptidase domain-containing protein, partial [Candidatus Bipolaricaulota bacterium]|nr:trypsin-like peptidase domain-containing protein [Candidatus Bipolaricaulota bacterium]
TATVVGMDSSNDLAVLQIDAGSSLPAPLPLADSDALRVGQTVLAIGSPYGLQQTLTTGVVSALGRVIESPEANQFIGEVIQTDAAINPGNSGGPLLDLEGRVIGVNSQILSPSGSSSGIGFAISASTIQRVVPQLITYGSYQHAWLGIETINLNQNTTQILRQAGADLTVEEGVLIVSFDDGSPAKAAGLHAGSHQTRIGPYLIPLGGDVIVAVDGAPVKTMADLTVYLEMETAVGQTVRVTVVRNGSQLEIPVELAARPSTCMAHKAATRVPNTPHGGRLVSLHRQQHGGFQMKNRLGWFAAGAMLLTMLVLGMSCLAQTTTGDQPPAGAQGARQVDLFGGGAYPGGYLKYTYSVSREGANRNSSTSTESTPQADGTDAVVSTSSETLPLDMVRTSTSSETLPLDMVRTGFFGIPIMRLGIHVSENNSGTIDLSPLDNISSSAIEPGKDYLLPDGGDFKAGSLGTIAGVEVVYGTYTNANYTNVEIQLAFPVDLTIRALLPFPAMMEFRYSAATDQPLSTFSLVKLTEFVRRP